MRRRHRPRIASSARERAPIVHHNGAMRKNRRRRIDDSDSAKNRFWRATIRPEAGEDENFFVAKNRDSESTQPPFGHY